MSVALILFGDDMPENNKKVSHYNTDLPSSNKKTEEIDAVAKFVIENWDDWDNHWSGKFQEFDRYYDQWIGKPPKRDEDWQAQFHKRLTWQAEKVLVARYYSALFPVSAPIDAEAVEAQDEMQKLLAKSIVSHWFKVGRIGKEFLSGMRSAGIYGTGLFEDGWLVRKEERVINTVKEIPDYRPVVDMSGNKILDELGNIRAEQIGTKKVNVQENKLDVVEDRYNLKKSNIYSWRIHPNKLDDDDDYPAIKIEYATYDDLLERQQQAEKYGYGAFENMDKIEKDVFSPSEEDMKRLQKDGEYDDKKNPRIQLLTYWGLYADKKENDKNAQKKPMCIMVVNRKYVIKKMENPFRHKKPTLFHIVWTEDERPSYYGIGIAQIGKDAEDRANTVVNIRTDVKKKNLRSGGWYNALDKKIKKSSLQTNVPGLFRACSDVNAAIKYDVPPGLSVDDYKEEETAVNDHREITGATTSLLPTADVGQQHKTLGGMELLVNQGQARLKPDLQMMEIMGIRRIADRALLLTTQFMTKTQAIELVASEDQLRQMGLNKIYDMSPREIIGSVNFFCTGLSESLDKLQNIDKLLKFIEIFVKTPQTAQLLNLQEIAKQIAYWMGIENVDKFINSMPMIPQIPGAPMPAQQMIGGVPQLPQGMPPPMPMPSSPQQGLPPQILQAIIGQMMAGQGQGMPVQ